MNGNGKDFISGKLAAIDATDIGIRLLNGDIKYRPYNGLDSLEGIDLQWIFENMGERVMCQLEDGIITDIKPLGKMPAWR